MSHLKAKFGLRDILIPVSLICLTACNALQTSSVKHDPITVKAEALAAFNDYIKASNSQDYDLLSTYYDSDPDFHWIERGQLIYQSGDDAVASIKSFAEQGAVPKVTITQTQISDLSDRSVLLSAKFEFQMLMPSGEPMFTAKDWMTVAMVKRETGWVLAGGQSGGGNED